MPIGVNDLSHVKIRPVAVRASDSSDINVKNGHGKDDAAETDKFRSFYDLEDSFRTAIGDEVRLSH